MSKTLRVKSADFNEQLTNFMETLSRSDIEMHIGHYSNHALATKVALMLLDSVSDKEVIFDYSFSSWCILRLDKEQLETLSNLKKMFTALIITKTNHRDFVDLVLGVDTLTLVRG